MKLSGWTIVIIGLCLGLSAVSYALFQVYLPYETAAEYNRQYYAELEAEANKMPRAVKRVEDAIALVNVSAMKWNQYVLTKTPPDNVPSGGINVFENPYQLVVDTPKYRNSAQRAFNAQVRKGGVRVVSAPEIPHPTDSEKDILAAYYNYPAFSFPVVLWELGSVTVQGTYRQISANVRAWSNMPRYLAVVDGLRIDGTSPNLTATYNVTVVGFLKASQVYPAAPVGESSGSGGGNPAGGRGTTGGGAGPATMTPFGG
jgi:hypothetical protein